MDGLIGASRMLAVVDGLEAWKEVCAEIRRTFDDPFRGLPVLALFVLVLLAVWMNVRVARWLVSEPEGARKHHDAPRHHETDEANSPAP